jgi:hypothetical protein
MIHMCRQRKVHPTYIRMNAHKCSYRSSKTNILQICQRKYHIQHMDECTYYIDPRLTPPQWSIPDLAMFEDIKKNCSAMTAGEWARWVWCKYVDEEICIQHMDGWMHGECTRYVAPKLHKIWYLVSLTKWSYTLLLLFDVIIYQVNMLMFYNVQITYLTFVDRIEI